MKDITPDTQLKAPMWWVVGKVLALIVSVWILSQAYSTLMYELRETKKEIQEVSLYLKGIPTKKEVADALMLVAQELNRVNETKIDIRDLEMRVKEKLDGK